MNEYLSEYINLGLFLLIGSCFLYIMYFLLKNESGDEKESNNKNSKNLKKAGNKLDGLQLHFNHWAEFIVIFFLFVFFLLLIPFFTEIRNISSDVFFIILLIVFLLMTSFTYFIKVLEKEENNE